MCQFPVSTHQLQYGLPEREEGTCGYMGRFCGSDLQAYIVFAIQRIGHYGPYGLLLLAALGLVALGFLPERQSES
jgi:hypothetical protein